MSIARFFGLALAASIIISCKNTPADNKANSNDENTKSNGEIAAESEKPKSNGDKAAESIDIDEVLREQGTVAVGASIALLSALPECNTQQAGKLYLVSEDMSLRYCKDGVWFEVNSLSKPGSQESPLFDYDRSEMSSDNGTVTYKYFNGDKLLRTCSTVTTGGTIYDGLKLAGSMSLTRYTGEKGCQIFTSTSLFCYAPYKSTGKTCVNSETLPSSEDNLCMGFGKRKTAGVCADLNFTDIDGNICGSYSKPVRIKSGLHFVTCNVSFSDRVIIEPGTEIRFDNAWNLSSNNGMWAAGTAEQPINFTVSVNSPSKSWGAMKFSVDGSQPLETDRYFEFVKGLNFFENVTFDEREAIASTISMSFDNAFLRNVKFGNITNQMSLSQSIAWGITVTNNQNLFMVTSKSAIFKSQINSSLYLDSSSHLMWNTLTSNVHTSTGPRGEVSIIAYNKLAIHYCTPNPNSYHYGNARGGVYPADCGGTDNITSGSATTSSRRLVVPRSRSTVSAVKNQMVALLPFVCADKDGFLSNPTLEYDVSYEFDGGIYPYQGGTMTSNEAPSVSFASPESYSVKARTLNGSSDFMGRAEVAVEINDTL